MSVSIVIPVYNSEKTLAELLRRLESVMRLHVEKYEVILVNDGSKDNSWGVISRQILERSSLVGLNLMRNYGQHNALLAGIRQAQYDVIVTLDDDLQHPPEEIPKLLAKLAEGYDVVYGTPQEMNHSFWRKTASNLTKIALQSSMGVEVARQVSAFRAFRSEVRRVFETYQSAFLSIDVLLTWATTRFAAIPVDHHPRKEGHTNYTVWKLITHATNMLTGFSILPLRIASLAGFAFSFFGFLVLAWVVGRYLIQGGSVPGFPFLASIIAIFSGAQFFALGIIGEYLARMHTRLLGQPSYAIREHVSADYQAGATNLSDQSSFWEAKV